MIHRCHDMAVRFADAQMVCELGRPRPACQRDGDLNAQWRDDVKSTYKL